MAAASDECAGSHGLWPTVGGYQELGYAYCHAFSAEEKESYSVEIAGDPFGRRCATA